MHPDMTINVSKGIYSTLTEMHKIVKGVWIIFPNNLDLNILYIVNLFVLQALPTQSDQGFEEGYQWRNSVHLWSYWRPSQELPSLVGISMFSLHSYMKLHLEDSDPGSIILEILIQ